MARSAKSVPRIPVRQATATDVEAEFRLLTLFATSYRPSRKNFDRNYLVAVDSPLSDLLVAEDGHDILGYIYANVIAYLASDNARLVTGSIVRLR